MDEVSGYIYAYAPLCWAVLAGFGGLVVTLSPETAASSTRLLHPLGDPSFSVAYYFWLDRAFFGCRVDDSNPFGHPGWDDILLGYFDHE